jgi:HD superfamily phosphohydrolase
MRLYEVRDPIYGFITFNEWEKEIINTPVFQRLRRIRQLALTDMVYPGAMHTRFEHSLGVMHLASLMYDKIIEKEENLKILKESPMQYEPTGIKRQRQIIRLAALFHDIGHGPFSHTSDEIFPINPMTDKPYKHEQYSGEVIENTLKKAIEENEYNKSNYNIKAEEISALLSGDTKAIGEKIFWKILISSQLDADRCDYLLRDSYHTGVKYGVFDHSRLINTIALSKDPETDFPVIAINEGGWHIAEAIMIARYKVFIQILFHKTRRAYDYHLQEAMKAVLPDKLLPSPDDIDDFLALDDVVMWNMFCNNQSDFDCNSIISRNHIRVVYYTPEVPELADEEEKDIAKEKLNNAGIWNHEDKAEAIWYNKEASDEKIWIISKRDNKIKPLNEYSSIVENMGEVKQIRLYVKPKDRKKALKVLKNGR